MSGAEQLFAHCASLLYAQLCANRRNFSMYFIHICAKVRTFVHNFATLRSSKILLTFAWNVADLRKNAMNSAKFYA